MDNVTLLDFAITAVPFVLILTLAIFIILSVKIHIKNYPNKFLISVVTALMYVSITSFLVSFILLIILCFFDFLGIIIG